jgi:type I restriction-modification system DNA methylase subunit
MEQRANKLIVANYTEYPGPRYCNQGNSSGEEFYHDILNTAFANAIESNQKLEVVLDGTAGYASSFLDEAFGNLVFDFSLKVVKNNITITSKQEPDWVEMIFEEVFNDWELRRTESTNPKKTKEHSGWFRYSDGRIIKKIWL